MHKYESQHLATGEDTSYQEYRAKKDAKSLAFMSDPSAPMTLTIACIATEPIDHLSARLQHLDCAGHGMTEILHHNLLEQCQVSLYSVMHPHLNESIAPRSCPVNSYIITPYQSAYTVPNIDVYVCRTPLHISMLHLSVCRSITCQCNNVHGVVAAPFGF